MTEKGKPDIFIKRVITNLEHANELKKKGNLNAAEDFYLEASINMIYLARTTSHEGKIDSIRRARNILDGIIGLDDGQKSSIESRGSYEDGWKLLADIGIDKPNVPETSLKEVAGLEEAKKELTQTLIYPLKYKELSEKYGVKPSGGTLLYGPPGTGKTHLAKALANEANANFINISPSRLYNQWFGEFEKNITKLFKAARILSPSLLFFDEIEALAPSRGVATSEQVSKRGVSQFLLEMEGFEKSAESSVFIIAATNRPWDIDEALLRPGRFDVKVYIGLPDLISRIKLFNLYLKTHGELSENDLTELGKLTSGYSGADISYICRRYAAKLLAKSIETGEEADVDIDSIQQMIDEVRPSVSRSTLDEYEKYRLIGR